MAKLVQKTILAVGDSACGKSYLYLAYAKDEFSHFYIPTVFDNYHVDVEVDGTIIEFHLEDVGGSENYDKLRIMRYKNIQADVILMCFSVTMPFSFANIKQRWNPEIKKYFPKVPIILVATQNDLRNNPTYLSSLQKVKQQPISLAEGQIMAKTIGAVGFVECSAKTKYNVNELFEMTGAVAVNKIENKKTNVLELCTLA